MGAARGYTLATLPAELRLVGYWPTIDADRLGDDDRDRFENLKRAVELYLSGQKVRRLLEALDVSYDALYSALRRCTSRHSDGLIFGFRALIPGIHVKPYTRRKPAVLREGCSKGGFSGAMSLLLRTHAPIESTFNLYIRTGNRHDGLHDSVVTHQAAHAYFLKLCTEAGVSDEKWPFCTKWLGKSAVRDYVARYQEQHYDAVVQSQYGDEANAKSASGTGVKSRLIATFPYDVVEVDEHKAHFIGSIRIKTPSGPLYIPIGRVTIITVVDRRSATVIGYHAVFAREVSAEDVLQAIHNALQPWARRSFTLDGLIYEDGAGFPSGRLPCLAGCSWCMLLLDNALAHLANDILFRARQWLGCDINFGPVAMPVRRPICEGVFRALCRHGFVRVDSTTGSGIGDPRRKAPTEAACSARLDVGGVLDLVELTIAHHNAEESRRNHGRSGLDLLEGFAQDEELGWLLPTLPVRPAHVAALNRVIRAARITGSKAAGVRPRVYALHSWYTSTVLAHRFDLIGSEVNLHVDPYDVSEVEAFSPSGESLGRLSCADEWGETPCSLEDRNHIADELQSQKLQRRRNETWFDTFRRSLKQRALNEATAKPKKVSEAARDLAEHERQERERLGSKVANETAAANEPARTSATNTAEPPDEHNIAPVSDVYDGLPCVLPIRIRAIN